MSFSVPKGPERIVCLTEEPTEILYCLGEGDRVVGISAYTLRPPEARRDKPVVSAFIGGSVEKISALEPDLVIGFSDIQADLARDLIAANLPVLIFNQRSLQEILEVIVDVGRLVGARSRAEKLVAGYIDGLAAAEARAAARRYRPIVYFEEWDDPMISGIQWVSEIIEIAGGRDAFRDQARGKLAKERFLTPEDVTLAAPELILASWCGKAFEPAALRERLRGVPAVETDQVFEIAAEIILQPGPACLTDGLAAVEEHIAAVCRGE